MILPPSLSLSICLRRVGVIRFHLCQWIKINAALDATKFPSLFVLTKKVGGRVLSLKIHGLPGQTSAQGEIAWNLYY